MKRMCFLDRKVDQIGYVVKDIDETVKRYYETFGIGDWKIYTYGPPPPHVYDPSRQALRV